MPVSAERQLRPGAGTLTSPASVDPIASPGKRTLVAELSPHPAFGPGGATTIGRTAGAATASGAATPSGTGTGTAAIGTAAIGRALDLCQLGLSHLDAIETALVPAYRRAVAAMDTPAVEALAWQVIGGVARIVDAQGQAVQLVPQVDTGPRAVMASTAKTDPGEPDPSQLTALTKAKASLDTAIHIRVPALAARVSPQWFGDELVAGRNAEPPPHVKQVLVQLAYEAETVVQLLHEAEIIARLVRPTDDVRGASEQATEGARAEALDRVERWRSRPINFLFLVRVLSRRGVWQELQGARNASGHTAEELQRKVTAQSRETGTTADVGALWDVDEAHRALSYSRTDWRITEDEATRVLEMLAQAEPRARAGLVKQLYRMGRLGPMCEHLPWGTVKQLWESIDDAEASRLLEPYWVGRGGGKSLGKRLQEQDHWYTDFLNRALDISTFGAKPAIDAAHDAREAGLISDGAYWGSVTKAIGRSAFVMAAMTATGGAAGEFAGEFTGGALEEMGVASRTVLRSAATVAGGVAGGGVGNVAGHLVGDIYDQVLDGKNGFDSLGSYGHSLKEGAIFGGVAGGVTAAAGLAASRYLPPGLRTVAQQAAATRPQLVPLLEAARSAGRNVGAHVQLTVRRFLEMIGDNGPPPGFRLAYATGASAPLDLERLRLERPDSRLWVTVRPLKDLNAPLQAQRSGDDEIVEVDFEPDDATHVEEPHGSGDVHLPDGYGDLNDHDGGVSVRDARNAGVVPEEGAEPMDQHHIFPQSAMTVTLPNGIRVAVGGRSWFKARGIDIDDYCVDLTELEHRRVHGIEQNLARKYWREWEWRSAISDELARAEALQARLHQDPHYKLSPDEIWAIANRLRARFEIADRPFIQYKADLQ